MVYSEHRVGVGTDYVDCSIARWKERQEMSK